MRFTNDQPDPILTANILARNRLDDVLAHVIAPFRAEADKLLHDEYRFMWVRRSLCNGEHLKLRVHGQPQHRDALKQMLSKHAVGFFEALYHLPREQPHIADQAMEPDLEKEMAICPHDRTLVWTTYRRMPVSLPPPPWVGDDCFTAQFCRCLGQGLELLLVALEAGVLESASGRYNLLVKALVSGLGVAWSGKLKRNSDYVTYHRDWLLRFFVEEEQDRVRALQQFDKQAQRSEAMTEDLLFLVKEKWQTPAELGDGAESWVASVAEMAAYVRSFEGRADYQVDPFTLDVSFPPFFKVFHGLANEIGLAPMQEAYIHHLLFITTEKIAGALSEPR
jgi:hypothetical protein